MIRYVFKDDAPVIIRNASKANAQKIGEELAAITQAASGRLTPEGVVNAARSPKSALHPHFEWNDKLAAQSYRLDQARAIIRLIRVEDEETQDIKPAFISIADQGTSYRTVQEVASSRELQLIVLQQCERDLKAAKKRYFMLNDVCEALQQALDKITERKSNIETRAAA